MANQRRHERVLASIPIDWGTTPACLQHDRITSFSVGGCFLQTVEAVSAFSIIYLRFFLSNEGERIITGEVRYNLEAVGLGVQFLNLPKKDERHLQVLLDYYRDKQL